MTFQYKWIFINLLIGRPNLFELNKNISFYNYKGKKLLYKEMDRELEGSYDCVTTQSEYNYAFFTDSELENPFHLFITCLCHKVLLRPYSW